ncbi:(d)CMP kinase [Phenylobacterium sp. LH3H17]|uniref:(d)CMP kinase n=1 Tax=Phenylobacterium sp. LH3H17 TaxID=2903901 RepID=UPI0020C96724|nr:(d)CMP kinase [Phenylobacterium sp. LH3H17]UTP39903.1 (d)CMP kinase [Phenylobacterium sp. LH3H17]
MSEPFVIAVDGPAASGKGTIAHRLGEAYDMPVLDSGLLYRAVGVLAARKGIDFDAVAEVTAVARALTADVLGDPAFRTREAGEAASRVAIHTPVRLALREMQQAFARRPGGAVIDGRDIGTVIAPEAPAKLYVTAAPEVRAGRRWKQLKVQGEAVTFEEILDDIRKRDARDGGRADSPMRPADDAVLLDTSEMTIEQATDAARRIVEAARARWERS